MPPPLRAPHRGEGRAGPPSSSRKIRLGTLTRTLTRALTRALTLTRTRTRTPTLTLTLTLIQEGFATLICGYGGSLIVTLIWVKQVYFKAMIDRNQVGLGLRLGGLGWGWRARARARLDRKG